jgi:hypothetical protein
LSLSRVSCQLVTQIIYEQYLPIPPYFPVLSMLQLEVPSLLVRLGHGSNRDNAVLSSLILKEILKSTLQPFNFPIIGVKFLIPTYLDRYPSHTE